MSAQARKVIRKVEVDITVNTAAYTAGDFLHTGEIELVGAFQGDNHGGRLVGITVIDQDGEESGINFLFFADELDTTTVTVNAAGDITDADLDNHFLGIASIAGSEYVALADNSVVSKEFNLPLVTDMKGVRDLYVVALAIDTPTYTATTDLKAIFYFEQD